MRCAGLPADFVQVVHQFRGIGTEFHGNFLMIAFKKTGIYQFVDIIHIDAQFVKQAVDHPGDENPIAGVPCPALLPDIIEFFMRPAIVVDKVARKGVRPLVLGNDIGIARHQRSGPIAEPHLMKMGGSGLPPVTGRNQDILSPTA